MGRGKAAHPYSFWEREGGGFLKQPPGMPTLLHCLAETSQLNRREGANFAILFRNESMEPWELHPAEFHPEYPRYSPMKVPEIYSPNEH